MHSIKLKILSWWLQNLQFFKIILSFKVYPLFSMVCRSPGPWWKGQVLNEKECKDSVLFTVYWYCILQRYREMYCTLYIAQSVQWTPHSALYLKECTAHWTLNTAILQTTNCTLTIANPIQFWNSTLNTEQHCTLYSVHCIQCTFTTLFLKG